MSQKLSEAVSDTLTRAMSLQPFFSSYFYANMRAIETDEIPTAATDGKRLLFNPQYMERLTMDERLFVFCHEVMHGVMLHMQRAKNWDDLGVGPDGKPFDHRLANMAADYIINSILDASRVGRRPKGTLLRADIDGTWTLEDAYKQLASERQKQPKSEQGDGEGSGESTDDQGNNNNDQGEDHGGFDRHLPATEQVDENEARVAVKAALQTAKIVGDVPATLERALNTLLEPKIDWTEQLRRALEPTVGRDDHTWSRPNRRRLATMGLYFPRVTGYQTGGVCVVIDTSGSVSDDECTAFLSEVSGIMSTCRPEWVKVLWCDSRVQKVDEPDEPEDLPYLTRKGFGGTDMGAALRYIKEHEYDPETIVVLTDGYTPWGEEPEYAKTVWGITTKGIEAPFGETIHVEVN